MNRKTLDDIKKTVIFIGRFEKNIEGKQISVLSGTGLLLNIDGIFHLITAKHVVCEVDSKGKVIRELENLWFFCNGKEVNKNVIASSLINLKKNGLRWYFHESENVDLAIIPFLINIKISDIKTYPNNQFLNISDIYETNEVFYISYQPGISNIEKDSCISPIVRKGIISRINKDETIYLDGFAFPGNSGSPVFMLPEAARFTESGITIGADKIGGKFVGIIGSYLPYQDIAISLQTRQPRIIFEENTGLSKVWSTKFIKEIIESDAFKKNIDDIKKKNEKQS